MLRLSKQVGRVQLGIDRVVGDHHGFGRTGEQVDADTAEQLTLGFGDKGVAGPDKHMHRIDGLGADGHGTDRLNAAERIDFMRTAKMHRGNDRRVRTAFERRCRGDDTRHARDRSRQHRHMRRSHHRELAGRHIATDGLHRDILVAQNHAGKRLDLDILHRGALDFGEFADLILRKADIVHVALRNFGDQLVDLPLAQPVARRREIVELLGKLAHRGVAPCLDVGKRRFYNGTDLGIVLGTFHLRLAAFQISNGHQSLQFIHLPGAAPDARPGHRLPSPRH